MRRVFSTVEKRILGPPFHHGRGCPFRSKKSTSPPFVQAVKGPKKGGERTPPRFPPFLFFKVVHLFASTPPYPVLAGKRIPFPSEPDLETNTLSPFRGRDTFDPPTRGESLLFTYLRRGRTFSWQEDRPFTTSDESPTPSSSSRRQGRLIFAAKRPVDFFFSSCYRKLPFCHLHGNFFSPSSFPPLTHDQKRRLFTNGLHQKSPFLFSPFFRGKEAVFFPVSPATNSPLPPPKRVQGRALRKKGPPPPFPPRLPIPQLKEGMHLNPSPPPSRKSLSASLDPARARSPLPLSP